MYEFTAIQNFSTPDLKWLSVPEDVKHNLPLKKHSA